MFVGTKLYCDDYSTAWKDHPATTDPERSFFGPAWRETNLLSRTVQCCTCGDHNNLGRASTTHDLPIQKSPPDLRECCNT